MNVWIAEAMGLEDDTWIVAICATEERAHQAIEDDKKSYGLLFERQPQLAGRTRYAVYDMEVLE